MTDKNIYGAFKTDKGLEKAGVLLDYGQFRVRIARAGGSNKAYQRLLEAKLRPYQRAIKTETIDPDLAEEIVREVYSKTVVLGWETKVEDKGSPDGFVWAPKLQTTAGELVSPTPDAISKLFKELPDLFADIQEQSTKAAVFREAINEANSGN